VTIIVNKVKHYLGKWPNPEESACVFFFKREQKLCSNLLIKKKRIAQLINRKLSKNRYNKPQVGNLNKQDNQQARSNYHDSKLEHHATKKIY
jgi:hypothetical protein